MNALRTKHQRAADRLEMLKQQEEQAVQWFKLWEARGDIEGQALNRHLWNRILDEIEMLQSAVQSGDLEAYEKRRGKLE